MALRVGRLMLETGLFGPPPGGGPAVGPMAREAKRFYDAWVGASDAHARGEPNPRIPFAIGEVHAG